MQMSRLQERHSLVNVTIDTDNTDEDGVIKFTSTVDSKSGSTGNLTILAGDTDDNGGLILRASLAVQKQL